MTQSTASIPVADAAARARHARPRRRHPRRGSHGVTLLEAMLATVLLTLTVAAMSEALGATIQAERAAQRHGTAIKLGKDVLDIIAAKPASAREAESESAGLFDVVQMPSEVVTSAAVLTAEGVDRLNRAVASELEFENKVTAVFDAAATIMDTDAISSTVDLPGVTGALENYQFSVRVEAPLVDGKSAFGGNASLVTIDITDPSGRTRVVQRLILGDARSQ